MTSKKQRFRTLWIVSSLLSVGVLLSTFDSWVTRSSFLMTWDQLWFSSKQKLEHATSKTPRRRSQNIQVLKLHYPNRVDFWFDAAAKKALVDKILLHTGPMILNFEPQRLIADSEMSRVFESSMLIRPVRIDSMSRPDIPFEKEVSSLAFDIHPDNYAQVIGATRKIYPEDIHYFQSSEGARRLTGTLDIFKDERSSKLESYPLFSTGSIFPLPTVGWTALRALKICDDRPSFSAKADRILCQTKSWPRLLPLYFYESYERYPSTPIEAIEAFHPDHGIGIVEVVDGTSPLFDLHGEKISYGDYLATAVSNLIQTDYYDRPDWMPQFEFYIGLAILVLLLLGSIKLRPTSLLGLLGGIVGIIVAFDLALTLSARWRTHPIELITATLLFGVTLVIIRMVQDRDDRLLLEKAFSGYVSPARLKGLLDGSEQLSLEGRRAEISTLILDIAGFSKISEKVKPEEVFQLLKSFFAIVDPAIFRNAGVIDKKTGDGLFAFFGDQKSDAKNTVSTTQRAAFQACAAALEIQALLQNAVWPKELKVQKIEVRIGVNTGTVFIGNAGSAKHFNYTVLGESVNFTQRLEAACPKGSVLIGERTYELVRDQIQCREVQIEVKNKQDRAVAYEILTQP